MKPIKTCDLKKSVVAITAYIGMLAGAGVATNAHAVHINPDGTGQALVFPYYTVRGAYGGLSQSFYDTYVSVTNTTAETKAIKVRFLEGKRGAEVLAFNVYLGGFDVWTGAVVATANGARLVSADTSCVVPLDLFSNTLSVTEQATPNVFKNASFIGDSNNSLDRTREGHIEVLEMGVVINAALKKAISHASNGKPIDCAAAASNEQSSTGFLSLTGPTGGLYGGASLINQLGGFDYSYDATAFQNWYDPRVGSIWSPAHIATPTLVDGGSLVSDIFTDNGDKISSTWNNPRDAISATMMREAVMNDYVLDVATGSGTDWIVTMPTKRFYAQVGVGAAAAPFNVNYSTAKSAAGDIIKFSMFNREEAAPIGAPADQIVCAPPPPTPQTSTNFCWSANVMTFNNSLTLGATNVLNIMVPYQNGWSTVRFEEPKNRLDPITTAINDKPSPPLTHYGLPVIGFMVQDFKNGALVVPGATQSVLSSYGGQFNHKYKTRIGDR